MFTMKSNNKQPKKINILLWILGWICIFPLPLTIILIRNKRIKPIIRIIVIVLSWIVYFMIGSACINNNDELTNSTTESRIDTLAEIQRETEKFNEDYKRVGNEVINGFVDKYNSLSSNPLIYKEDFVVQDSNSEHYKREFRLNAYKNSVGKSYALGEVRVDIIYSSRMFDDALRVYVDNASFEQCYEVIKFASPVMDEDIENEEIQDALDYVDKNREANGYYYGNLCIVLSGKYSDSYRLMIKQDTD